MAKRRIFIVDDEKNILDALGRNLASLDAEVRTFQEADQAWEEILREQPDMVITDLRLAGVDGLEMLARIQALGGHTQVVLMTGSGEELDLPEARDKGAYACLHKPFHRKEVLDIILRALDRAGLLAEIKRLRDKLSGLERQAPRPPSLHP